MEVIKWHPDVDVLYTSISIGRTSLFSHVEEAVCRAVGASWLSLKEGMQGNEQGHVRTHFRRNLEALLLEKGQTFK